MDSLGSQSWSQAEQQLDPMAQMTNDLDNLGDFLDFGEIDLDIPDLDTTQYGDHVQQPQQVSHSDTPFNDLNQAQTPQGISALDFGGAGQFELSQNLEQHQSQYNRHVQASHPLTTGPGYQPAMQQNLQYPTQQFQYHPQAGFLPHHHVPPTPNSLEMHGEAGHFMHQHQLHQIDPKQQALLEQHYRARKDDTMAFTPMVSPTGTPLYNMQPEFTAPGAYFSPLTSPMLHGQNGHNASQSQHLQGYYTNPSTAPSSNATSPIDLSGDVSMMGDGLQLPESAAALPRRSRRKAVTPRNVAANARMRQSPVQKAQKRKSGTLSQVISSRDDLLKEAQLGSRSQPNSAGLQIPAPFNTSSEDGSISPEPLSESIMGPPPRPASSLTPSPAIAAQRQKTKANAAGSAATPKSILSSTARQQPTNGSAQSDHSSDEPGALEELQLPEAATTRVSRRPSLAQIDTQMETVESPEQTPRFSARKTPKLGPLSTPLSTRLPSVLDSPSVASPMGASTPGNLLKDKRSDFKGSKGNKKRGSASASGSAMASPAIRPRISPSIKPLLPEGSKFITCCLCASSLLMIFSCLKFSCSCAFARFEIQLPKLARR